jgi:signal transduction histidine kinase
MLSDETQRLLAFSRQQPLNPKTIDPNRLVHNLVEMHRRTLGERVKVKTVLGFDTGLVEADPTELENALLNLVVNSRDAMPEGGTITIETARVDDDKLATVSRDEGETQYVLITVCGQWRRHGSSDACEGVRSILHNQGGRPRHRAWPQSGSTALFSNRAVMCR